VLLHERGAITPNSELDALLALDAVVPAELRSAWHARFAVVAQREHGRGASIAGGEPVGFHLLAAGQPEQAAESLRATLELAPADARARAFLGDALYLVGAADRARREYFCAFLDDPSRVALEHIADPAIARLVDLARDEYELEAPAAPRVPAIGIVERVFSSPQAQLPGLLGTTVERTGPAAFVELIARERAGRTLDERVAARRQMKAMAPRLFESYLKRLA
jgi:hypothetical protein